MGIDPTPNTIDRSFEGGALPSRAAADTVMSGPVTSGPVTSGLAGLGAVLLLLTGFAVTLISRFDIPAFVSVALVQAGVYVAAVVLILRSDRGSDRLLWLILVIAVLVRLLAMTAPPNLTTDAYRYVFDGKLVLEGVNPYLYVPADPRLEAFRDPDIYPFINKKEIAHTIYPPVAQFVFAAGAWLSDGLTGQKLVMFGFELITMAALIVWLRSAGLPQTRVLLYAWHPLVIWEFSSQAHLDSAVTALLVLAIVTAARGRQALSGVWLALGALVKFYPIIFIPGLWRRWDWRMPTAFLATAALAYAPFVGEAGFGVFGFLGQHLDNEGYRAGWGFHPIWLLRDFKIADPPVALYLAIALGVLFALALVAFFRRGRGDVQPHMLALIGAAFVFFTSPHYPWYAAFLVAFLPMVPHPALVAMTVFALVLQVPRSADGLGWSELYVLAYWVPLALWLALTVARHTTSERRVLSPASGPVTAAGAAGPQSAGFAPNAPRASDDAR